MNQRIVLAFNGRPASCAALKWLANSAVVSAVRRTGDVDIIALIIDVGQSEDPEETRSRALSCGAQRVHVVERLAEFARRAIVPAAAVGEPLDERALKRLAYPVIAAALVEVATIERADAVAHGSADEALDAEIHALAPDLRVIAPARESLAPHIDTAPSRPDRHLLMRGRVKPAAAGAAAVTIEFDAGIPISINGVAMALPELIESLSLIGGQYRGPGSSNTPALTLLQTAYRESAGHGSVTLQLQPGALTVFRLKAEATSVLVKAEDTSGDMVTHA